MMTAVVLVLSFCTNFGFIDANSAYIRPGTGCGECIIPSSQAHLSNTDIYGINDDKLVSSNTTEPAYSSQCINIPFNILYQIFHSSNKWCLWNPLFGPISALVFVE